MSSLRRGRERPPRSIACGSEPIPMRNRLFSALLLVSATLTRATYAKLKF